MIAFHIVRSSFDHHYLSFRNEDVFTEFILIGFSLLFFPFFFPFLFLPPLGHRYM